MGKSSQTMFKSLSETLGFLDNLEKEFENLRSDASRLKTINEELHEDFVNFSSIHMKRAVA